MPRKMRSSRDFVTLFLFAILVGYSILSFIALVWSTGIPGTGTTARNGNRQRGESKDRLENCGTQILDPKIGSLVRQHQASCVQNDDSSDTTKTNTPPTGKFAIFYHLYVNPRVWSLATKVVREQMEDTRRLTENFTESLDSFWLPNNLTGPSSINTRAIVPFYFTTTGKQFNMTSFCPPNFHCHELGHYDYGFEDRTLLAMHEYCIDNPSSTVLYFHSKGSFHRDGPQKPWRRWMLAAALHDDCLYGIKSGQCDVCGLSFYSHFQGPSFPGNFFSARCDYVRKLLAPDRLYQALSNEWFSLSKEYGFDTTFSPTNDPKTTAVKILSDDPLQIGGRFAWEAWIGSHPSLRPCEMSTGPSLRKYWGTVFHPNLTDKYLQLNAAPAFPIEQRHVFDETTRKDELLNGSVQARLRYWFFLPGLLFRYYVLYQLYPDEDSWVWTFFPDSNFWMKQLALNEGGMLPFQDIFQREGGKFSLDSSREVSTE